MTTDAFIEAAINRGRSDGLRVLNAKEQTVYLIAEADAYCAMEGVDSLIDRIEEKNLSRASEAFAAVGATEIADCLKKIEDELPLRDDEALTRANDLITSHVGFSYEAIKRYVEEG